MSDEKMTEYDILLMDVQRSIRYHDRRKGYYQALLGLSQFVILMFGMTTIATFGAEIGGDWPLWVRLLPSVMASTLVAVTLVYRVSDKAWLHHDLKHDFIRLEQRLERIRSSHTPEEVSEIQADRLGIEAREPKVLRVLDTICHNEIMRAMGYEQTELVEIGFIQRLVAHVFDLREHTLHGKA